MRDECEMMQLAMAFFFSLQNDSFLRKAIFFTKIFGYFN